MNDDKQLKPEDQAQQRDPISVDGNDNIVGDENIVAQGDGAIAAGAGSEVHHHETHVYDAQELLDALLAENDGDEAQTLEQLKAILVRHRERKAVAPLDEKIDALAVKIDGAIENFQTTSAEQSQSLEELRQNKDFMKNLGWLVAELAAGVALGELIDWVKGQAVEAATRRAMEKPVRVPKRSTSKPCKSKSTKSYPSEVRLDRLPRKLFEPELVRIPAGWFLMGSDPRVDDQAYDDEQPQHRVYQLQQ